MTIPPLDWKLPETWLLALFLLALLLLPLWLIGRQSGLSGGRKAVRLGLHGLLWLAVLGLWLQPRWPQTLPAGSLLLTADHIPIDTVRATANRLGVKATWSVSTFRELKTAVLPVDTVWLLGQDFREQDLARLSRQVVRWLPYRSPGQLEQIQWKGIVRQGEPQTVTGAINTPEGGMLRLRFGRKTVDSTRLEEGNQIFRLSYLTFSPGRTALTLSLDKALLDTIRFVARPIDKLRVRFVLDAPDFETRALADWLGQQGHTVELTNRLSKGIGSELSINKAAANALPDLVVTDPGNVANPLVGKAVAAGKSALVLNLSRPDTDIPAINRALRTAFQARRIPGKDTIRLGPDLTAVPFRFAASTPNMILVAGYPVAVQSVGGRVAASLLTETFPLRLSGDSTAYARLWWSVLAPLSPAGQNNTQINAPLLTHQPASVDINNATTTPTRLRVGSDTLTIQPDPVSARTYATTGRFARASWLPIQDTLAVYAYNGTRGMAAVAQRSRVANWMLAHHRYDSAPSQAGPSATRTIKKAIPDWGWLLGISLLLTALWLEPKID